MESVSWVGRVQLVARSVRVVMSRVVSFLFMFLWWFLVCVGVFVVSVVGVSLLSSLRIVDSICLKKLQLRV